ncbi:MAG TPA: BON domain-containing protein [Thermoleophilia bacterium]|nr:BON domain-containing protein [Thermoleophilia bacterium]
MIARVRDELLWDARVHGEAIAVSAEAGVVTLRGTVGSFREKLAAENVTKRVQGVQLVDDRLELRLLDEAARKDAAVRGEVLQALALDSIVPSTVDAKVEDGMVTLTGTVEWKFERDEAEFVASNIVGARSLTDEINLDPPKPTAVDVRRAIRGAFKRNAGLDAERLSVTTMDGTVTIDGIVRSWAEHDEAIDAARSARGVTKVDDRITILP